MRKINVNDSMQKNYTYVLSEPEGKNFDEGFEPQLTPQEMLKLGVFGGNYFKESISEYPKSWQKDAKIGDKHDKNLNYFKVDASQPLSVWQKKGWIHPQDPRGWFQWYCRYYMGRRSVDDERQIKRWKAIKRHASQLQKYCRKGDIICRPRQRQALLHWAYDSRKL